MVKKIRVRKNQICKKCGKTIKKGEKAVKLKTRYFSEGRYIHDYLCSKCS